MDSEALEDYASCIDANEPYLALVLLFGFVKDSKLIPYGTVTEAFNTLNDENKEQYRFLMDPKFSTAH